MIELHETTLIHAPVERCFDLARSIEVHLIGNTHNGEQATAGTCTGLIGPGQQVTWRARHFGIRQHLTSTITAFDPPTYFQDTMLRGAFHSMQHEPLPRALQRHHRNARRLPLFISPWPFRLVGRPPRPAQLHAPPAHRAQPRHQTSRRVQRLATIPLARDT
jgi:hypothetical protein